MSNNVSVTIDVANQSIISSDTSIIGVPTENFEIVTFDNKPCIRSTTNDYATFTINPVVKGFSCDVFLQVVNGFTLFIEFDTILNTKYSLVYYPNGKWWWPDSAVFDSNNVLVGVWVTVTYSSVNKTITFDNGTNQLVRTVDSNIIDLSIGSYDGRYNIYLTNLGAETSSRYVNKSGVSEIWQNTKNYIASQLLGKSDVGHTHSASEITSGLATVATSGSYNDLSNKPTIPSKTSDLNNDSGFLTLESLSANSIPFHNAYPRCKYLGTSITDAQNTAIKNRTYDDLFIGDYWTIGGINWRIVAIDYYYNVGDTNFDKGNVIVMPDTVLYSAQMNETDTTAGAYAGSLMRTQNLNDARTIAQNAFGSHLANHIILLANSVDASGPSNWAWYNSDGVELPNEVQIYGTRAWGSALKGYDVTTQKQQFPLMLFAPQFVNTKQTYWLQDVSSLSVSSLFAAVHSAGHAYHLVASSSNGVRPSVTLTYI